MPNPTGQAIVTNALTRLGICGPGEAPSASDSQDALANLNDMWDAWSIDEGLIYAVFEDKEGPLVPNENPIDLPDGFPTNARIYQVVWVATVGSGQIRKTVKLVDADTYYAHSDMNASAVAPDEAFVNYSYQADPAFGTSKVQVFMFPVPNSPTTSYLWLLSSIPFTAWTLNAQYILPPGYEDAITWSLAYRLLSTFGAVVAQEVADNVTRIGGKAEARIREMNAKNRMLPQPAATSPEMQLQAATPQPPQQGR